MFLLDVSKVDLGVAHVAMAIHACFTCFTCFHTYVVNVLSGYFKSSSGVAHVAMAPVAGVTVAFLARHASPSSPFPSPPSPCHGSSSSMGKPYLISAHAPVEVVASGGPDGGAMPALWPRSKLRSVSSAHCARKHSSRGCPDASIRLNGRTLVLP